jgi:hypothetical protein
VPCRADAAVGTLIDRKPAKLSGGQRQRVAILNTDAQGFMCEDSKDFEPGVAMLPAKEQRAVPIGGASLVGFKGINDAQRKVRKTTENQLAAVVNDMHVTPEAAMQTAQKEADALMKPYVDKTALAELKSVFSLPQPLSLTNKSGICV